MEFKNLNLKSILLPGALILIFMGILYVIFVPRPIQVQTARASVGKFKETLRVPGLLRAKEKFTLSAFADGDLKRTELRVGDLVKKDQIITTLLWDLQKRPVTSPVEGVISKIFKESDGPVRRGEPLFEIIDPTQLEIVAEVLTTDAVRLKVGGEVTLANLYVDENLKGRIQKISKVGFTKPSALGVEEERTEVISEFVSESKSVLEAFGNSFHVDLEFMVNEVENSLNIPIGAIFRDGPNWAVYVVQNGRAQKRNIDIQALGSTDVQISNGLKEGEIVILYPGDHVREGIRVQY